MRGWRALGLLWKHQCAHTVRIISLRFSTQANNGVISLHDPRFVAFVDQIRRNVAENNADSLPVSSKDSPGKIPAILHLHEQFMAKQAMIEELRTGFATGEDDELRELALADTAKCEQQCAEIEEQLTSLLVGDYASDRRDVSLEVSAGVGGQEAMLFSAEIFELYRRYAGYKGWSFEVDSYDDKTTYGGLRNAMATVKGTDVYGHLKFEGGVHRVQRVPVTESSGRMHTSTAAVCVLPLAEEIDVSISSEDVVVKAVRSSSKGGQHANKTETCIQITHLPTGISVECQETRSQQENKIKAFERLRNQLYQRQLERQFNVQQSSRKLQVGLKQRGERIRTYNYQQARIVDHRIRLTLGCSVADFLTGSADFDALIQRLLRFHRQELLLELINSSPGPSVATSVR